MKRLIIDVSSIAWMSLLAGRDPENAYEVEHEGKKVSINSADYGYENAVNHLTGVMDQFGFVPTEMIFVVEGKMSKSRRVALYKDYKASRSTRPPQAYEEFNRAVGMLSNAYRNLGCQIVSQDGVEADDVIALLAKNLKGERFILSNDGDLTALMTDEVHCIRKGALVTENPYGPFPFSQITTFKALVGDSSDNYGGAKGFGEKAFLDMLVNFGDQGLAAIEGLIKRRALHELEEDVVEFKPFRKVIDGADMVYTSHALAKLYPEWVDTLRQPLQWKAGMVRGKDVVTDERLVKWAAQSRLVTAANYTEAVDFLKRKVRETPEFCLDLETTTPPESDEWLAERSSKGGGVDVIGSAIVGCGITFGNNGQYGYYISVDHTDTENVTLDQLRALLEVIPKDKVTVSHNAAGFELPVMYNAFGKAWTNNGWRGMYPNLVDSQIAASYWDEDQPSKGLKTLSKLLLDYEQETYAEVTTIDGVQYKMHELSAEHVFSYGMDDCYTAQGLYNFFKVIMEVEDSFDAFMRIEQKPMYLSALSFVQGTPISLERLLELKRADEQALPKHEATLHNYLISKGWEGSVCPKYEGELTPKQVKEVVRIVLGHELETQVRTVSKMAKLVELIEHDDAPLLARFIEDGSLDQINDWVVRRFDAKPTFNTGSFVQIGRLMYEVMGLPIRLRNRATDAMRAKGIREGNPQTDDDAINLAIKMGDATGTEAETLQALLEMKSINTRTGLYWEAYPKMIHWKTNRLHPEVRQCATNTRRHTGANPNIQQQDSTQGGVRTVVRPHHKDAVFVSLDLAGQEIRLLGDYSRDENILSAYIGDPPKDLHSFTAAMILGVTYEAFREQYESEDKAIAEKANLARQSGKTTFFASSYGAMAPKIGMSLGVSEQVAQGYLDALDKAFPGVPKWKRETEKFAEQYGWVPILGGNRRHLRRALLSDDRYTASKALRQASNARIQGAGGNQIRTIMGRVWDSNLPEQYDMRFYWPVHDECCFSVHRDHAVPVIKALHGFMCERFLDVLPSASSIGVGGTYGNLIEIGEVADAGLIAAAVEKCFVQEETTV